MKKNYQLTEKGQHYWQFSKPILDAVNQSSNHENKYGLRVSGG